MTRAATAGATNDTRILIDIAWISQMTNVITWSEETRK